MSANSLNATTYNNAAGNTVNGAVLSADYLLAWRQNVYAVVNQHATEVNSHTTKKLTDSAGVHGISIEYGSFTPEVKGVTTPGTQTYVFRFGEYYRIGRLVRFKLGLRLSSFDAATDGIIGIYGLPFARGGDSGNGDGGIIGQYANITVGAMLTCLILTDSIQLIKSSDNANVTNVTNSDFKNNSEVRISGTYLTS